MIAVIDYDAGNIRSVEKSIAFVGGNAVTTADKAEILAADGVILPGVGAFGDAMEKLRARGLDSVIYELVEAKKPFLGICLGMQMLFDESEESPGVRGLGILPGKTVRIPDSAGKVPHMGWNQAEVKKAEGIFAEATSEDWLYYVHGYYVHAENREDVALSCTYGVEMDVAVARGKVWGAQFHPEKSGEAGLAILRSFLREAGDR